MPNEVIVGLFTLGGIFIGIIGTFFTNRHTRNLEVLKINEERRKEKFKRNIAILEDAYRTLIKIDNLCDELAYDMENSRTSNLEEEVKKIKNIRLVSDEATVLIGLNIPNFKNDLEKYRSDLGNHWNAAVKLRHGAKGQPIKPDELRREADEAQQAYKSSLLVLRSKLEERMKETTSLDHKLH